eukprot:scaffold67365_cov21-Cyclotella_meneghiniana.AAC.1
MNERSPKTALPYTFGNGAGAGESVVVAHVLLGWLPSVSGCTPIKLCGGGEGPVGVDNLFTKPRS